MMRSILPFTALILLIIFSGCVSNDQSQNAVPTTHAISYDSGTGFLEQPTGYDNITTFTSVYGKLVYVASKNNKAVAVFDGSEHGAEYDTVIGPVWADGKIGYVASQNNKNFIVYDGKEIGRNYDAVINYFNIIGGQPLYMAVKNGKSLVVHGDAEIGTEYDSVQNLRDYNGKIAYIAWKDNKTFIMYDGAKTAEGYDSLEFLRDSRTENLSYTASKGDKKFIFYNGELIGGDGFDDIVSPIFVNAEGKLSYGTMENGKMTITYGDQQIEDYVGMSLGGFFKEVNGKLAYSVSDINTDSVKVFLVYDGQTVGVGKRYDEITNADIIGGNIAYIALNGDKRLLVYGDKETNLDYDNITNPQEIDGKLVFAAERNGTWYVVSER